MIMVKVRIAPDAGPPAAMQSCRVMRVDACNAVCMVHKSECSWATPYGNYCEHPLVPQLRDYEPAEARMGRRPPLH